MRTNPFGRAGAALGLTLSLGLAPAALAGAGGADGDAAVRVAIAFRDTSSCEVTMAAAAPAVIASPEPATGDFVCPLAGMPPRRAVNLEVTLPAGVVPTFADFPRLDWRERDGRWTGTASVPSAPSFVRVGGPSGSLARRARWLDTAALAGTLGAILWTLAYAARRANAGEIS
jgi:hypothetical protein